MCAVNASLLLMTLMRTKLSRYRCFSSGRGWAEDVEQACPFQDMIILADLVYKISEHGRLQLLFHLLIVCLFPSLSISAILVFSYKIWGIENLGSIPFFSDNTWKRHLSHSSCSDSTAGGHCPSPARPFPYDATDKTCCSQLDVLAEAASRVR